MNIGNYVMRFFNWLLLGAIAYKVFGAWGLAAWIGSVVIACSVNTVINWSEISTILSRIIHKLRRTRTTPSARANRPVP